MSCTSGCFISRLIFFNRARSATQKNVKHKHILLDKNSSYNLVGADGESLKTPPVSPSSGSQFVYKKTAGGTLAGVIKGAELEDLTITVTTEDDQRLKIKVIVLYNSFWKLH